MTGSRVRLLGLLGVLGLLGILPSAAAADPPSERVSMNHFEFAPAELTVSAGTTVTWTYDDDPDDPQPNCEWPPFQATDACPGHSTTAVDTAADGSPLWDSGVHRADGFPFSHTFDTPGRYEYFCSVHGGDNPNNPLTAMNGVIVVTPSGQDPAPQDESAPDQPEEELVAEPAGPQPLPRTGGAMVGSGLTVLVLLAAWKRPRG